MKHLHLLNVMIIAAMLFAAMPSPLAATVSTPVAPEPQGVGIEIEPQLQAQLDADGTTTYMIYFRERPDLSPAFQMDWRERGWFVMQALQGAAERSQARVRAYLDAQGAKYESFWVDNILVVTQSNRATFNGLLTFSEIKALRAQRTMRLIEPVARHPAQIVPMAIEPNISHVQADQAWALGLRGEGSVVASIDTGVRFTHQALVNHYRGTLGGGSYDHNYNWWDPYGSYNYPYDGNGHGTHTMGTMVGDDGGANQIGMAPGAKWMACRGCSTSGCGSAQLLECAQFMAAPWDLSHANVNPDKRPYVVNNSWGDCGTSYDNWYQTVVDNWHAAGIYPVFANGNASNCGYSSPPPCGTVGNPARYGNVTGVGSTGQSNGQYAAHSNRGPTDNPDTVNPRGYPTLKPQVAAPGVNIRSSVNTSDTDYQGGWSGTSMSAPHVTGLVALMWQAGQCLKGDYARTETLIEQTATPITTGLPGSCAGEGPGQLPNQSTGWGEINAFAAVQAARNACGPTGALAGVVSNGNPIIGAQVQAMSSPTQTGSTTSGAGGAYSMTLPVGTYTVTGSAYGYQPATISGVSIISGATTTQNIALTPVAMRIVSGTVSDATTVWPLYAHIAIQGNPVNPPAPYNDLWTNPVTGFYSVTLAEGITYTFNVNAWVTGYNAASRSVGPLMANRTENIALTANATTCNAPGYRLTGGLFENFDGVTQPNLPSNWAKVVVTGTYSDWATNAGTVHPSGGGTHSAPNVAYFNSFNASSGDSSRLYRTVGLNMTTVPMTTLSLWMYHDTGYSTSNDRLQVQVSTDGGTTWINVGSPISRYNGTTGWAQHYVDLSAYASQTSLRLGFLGISAFGNDVHIDDILLGTPTCVLQAGGLVVGNTYDANTSAPLAGAFVSNDSGRSATTVATVDPAVDDSFYTLFSPAGSHVFTATKTNYGTSIQTPTVVQSSTVRQNFSLPAGRLSYMPPSLQATLQMGLSTTVPFTLTNSGGKSATFELLELDKGVQPLGPFEQPSRVVKPFEQDRQATQGLNLPDPPLAGLYAAGDVIQSWPSGLASAWGIAYDTGDSTVWVASPAPSWGGNNTFYEYTLSGALTGRSRSFSWNPSYGPADAAYNWNTGMLWVMNVDTSSSNNCIYEVDPASGYTGNRLCPGGGFVTNQRGLAYDPSTDTWYAGSWNDMMIHHFDSTGVMLDEVNVGLAIAGLAYNPDTQHLFVIVNASPNPVYVLDAANNYTVLGQFTISGFGAGSGAGLEIDYNGHLWAVNQSSETVYEVDSGEATSVCSRDVPWLSESPISGTIASLANQPIVVTFDAGVPQVTQPGMYYAQLRIKHDTPYNVTNVPVTMTVNVPATYGKLTGTVTGLARCDAPGAPLDKANVFVQGSTGMTWTLTTNVSGTYQVWLDPANSPLTATVSHSGYITQTLTGIMVTQQQTTTQNLNLRLDAPCLSVNPSSLSVAITPGLSRTVPLMVSNTGAKTTTFELQERAGGFQPTRVATGLFVKPKPMIPLITITSPVSPSVGWDDPNMGPITPMGSPDTPSSITSGWASAAPMPTARARLSGVTGGCQLYTIGGMLIGSSTVFANNEKYDPQSNSWTTLTPMPTARSNMGAAIVNDVIYVPGGYNGSSCLSTHEAYGIANNSWSSKAPLPTALCGGVVAAVNGKVYHIGGSNGSTPVATTYEYDPTTNSWTTKAPALAAFHYAGSTVMNGYIYIAGGWSSSTSFWRYDPVGDSWTVLASLNQGRQSPGLVVAGGYIYAFGGGVGWTALNSTEQYNPSTNTWTPRPDSPLAVGRMGMATGWVRGKIWGAGGSTGNNAENVNEYLDEGYPDNCGGADVPWLSEAPVTGTVASGANQPISVTFTAPITTGIYTATLVVNTGDAARPTINVPVTMTVTASPVCGFTSSSPDEVGQTTYFTNTTTGDAPLTYNWNLGDNSVSSAVNPTHTYTLANLYTVVLTATNPWGQNICSHTVVIEGPPMAGFVSNSPVVLGNPGVFTNTTRANPEVTDWSWKFGDGDFCNDPTPPPHTYTSARTYTVTLTARNVKGSHTYTGTVIVQAPSVYGVTLTPPTAAQSGNPGSQVTYTLRLTNTGNMVDTFTLSKGSTAWTTDVPASAGPLAAGTGTNVQVVVHIPPGASGGATDAATITATSQADPTQSVTSMLTTAARWTHVYLPLVRK